LAPSGRPRPGPGGYLHDLYRRRKASVAASAVWAPGRAPAASPRPGSTRATARAASTTTAGRRYQGVGDIRSFLLGRRHRPAGMAAAATGGGLRVLQLDPGRAGWCRPTRVGRSALRAAAPPGEGAAAPAPATGLQLGGRRRRVRTCCKALAAASMARGGTGWSPLGRATLATVHWRLEATATPVSAPSSARPPSAALPSGCRGRPDYASGC